jgi:UDP-glucose 4-epimerase
MGTILVTGATGFIGSKLCGLMPQRGHKILALVRKIDSRLPQGCMPVLADLEDPEPVAEAVARCDIVIHLGAIVGNAACDADIERAIGVNVSGTLNVLSGIRFHRKPMIYASVGNALDNTSYAITKVTGERFCLMYNKEMKSVVLPLRIFNVYGPGQSPATGKLIPASVDKAIKGEELTYFGDGEQRHDFVHVDDVVQILVDAVDYVADLKAGPTEAMEVGTGAGVSIKEVLTLVNQLAGKKSRIISKPARPGESMRAVVADVSKRFAPRNFTYISLADGLEEMISKRSGEV